MNTERLKLLANEIISNKYIQHKGNLCRLNAIGQICHCVMGVACEMTIRDFPEIGLIKEQSKKIFYLNGNTSMIPKSVFDLFKCTYLEEDYLYSLSNLNDTGSTFQELSDKILEDIDSGMLN